MKPTVSICEDEKGQAVMSFSLQATSELDSLLMKKASGMRKEVRISREEITILCKESGGQDGREA